MKPTKSTSFFGRFSKATARATGRPPAFLAAFAVVAVWAVTGPLFGYSNTWQLAINTCTTVVTFLMVFLIQGTQNRDSEAMHLKLDELICAVHGAHNALLDLEELEEKDLDRIRTNYQQLARAARESVRRGNVESGRIKPTRVPWTSGSASGPRPPRSRRR